MSLNDMKPNEMSSMPTTTTTAPTSPRDRSPEPVNWQGGVSLNQYLDERSMWNSETGSLRSQWTTYLDDPSDSSRENSQFSEYSSSGGPPTPSPSLPDSEAPSQQRADIISGPLDFMHTELWSTFARHLYRRHGRRVPSFTFSDVTPKRRGGGDVSHLKRRLRGPRS